MSAHDIDTGIREIVGALTDPIIVMPGGWGEDIPEWLKTTITLERLITNIKALKTGVMMASDAEACAYLFTASLAAPIDHDWTQIYLYVAGKVYEQHRSKDSGVQMPADIKVEHLTENQQHDLDRLKLWIYAQRVKHRKRLDHDEAREQKDRNQEGTPEVLQLRFDL